MTNYCKNCEHWKLLERDNWQAKELGLKRCTKVPSLFENVDFDYESEKSYIKNVASKLLAFTQDGSDYWSVLYTKENYGCVQFEEKEK